MAATSIKITFFLLLTFGYVRGQNLPKVQTTSIWEQKHQKSDTRPEDQNDVYAAYNPTTQIYYTFTNNDTDLYLVVHVKNPRIIQKVLYGSLELSINTANKKNTQNLVSVRYPNLQYAFASSIIVNSRNVLYNAGARIDKRVDLQMTTASQKEIDSTRKIANEKLITGATEIKIYGFKGITDSILSIYNEEGIKTICVFNTRNEMDIKFRVPLTLINLRSNIVTYNLKLHSRLENGKAGVVTHYVFKDKVAVNTDLDIETPTDFWGEYTLAKKP